MTTPSLTRDGELPPTGVVPVVLAVPPARAALLVNDEGEAITGEALFVLAAAIADELAAADAAFPPAPPWTVVLKVAEVGVKALGVDETDDSLDCAWANSAGPPSNFKSSLL